MEKENKEENTVDFEEKETMEDPGAPEAAVTEEEAEAENAPEPAEKAGLSKKQKCALIVIGAIVLLILAGIVFLFSVLHFERDRHKGNSDEVVEFESAENLKNKEGKVADSFDVLEEIQGNDTLSSILKNWATNNTDNSLMHSDEVTNILLMGIDATGGNSDVIMLVSVNEKKKTVYLTSIMRDSYTYIKTERGEGYGKINSAYGNGGADCLVQTVENDFKIKVDYYVSVSFESFSSVVDVIGGVEVPVMEYEANAMGNLGEYGESVRLNGAQALQYCRIRKCDSDGDVSRTRRQRQFIMSLINRCSELDAKQMKDAVSTLLAYVKTDCPTTKIIGYGTKALLNKWYNYDVIPLTVPTPEFRMDYMGYAWVWIVDYPPLAQYLQDTIYGSSNIKLYSNHVSAIKVMRERNTGEATP